LIFVLEGKFERSSMIEKRECRWLARRRVVVGRRRVNCGWCGAGGQVASCRSCVCLSVCH